MKAYLLCVAYQFIVFRVIAVYLFPAKLSSHCVNFINQYDLSCNCMLVYRSRISPVFQSTSELCVKRPTYNRT